MKACSKVYLDRLEPPQVRQVHEALLHICFLDLDNDGVISITDVRLWLQAHLRFGSLTFMDALECKERLCFDGDVELNEEERQDLGKWLIDETMLLLESMFMPASQQGSWQGVEFTQFLESELGLSQNVW